MVNELHVYMAEGFKAGKAMSQGDHSLYEFQKRWFNEALSLEKPEDKPKAKAAWAEGYKTGRN